MSLLAIHTQSLGNLKTLVLKNFTENWQEYHEEYHWQEYLDFSSKKATEKLRSATLSYSLKETESP